MRHFKGAPPWRRATVATLAIALAAGLTGCGSRQGQTPDQSAEKSEVILASTTSTQDSGLFDVLIPAFEKANPDYSVKVIAVGTGEALRLGETKDADVLLVHAKADEEKFVADGYAAERKDVMYNDFLIVGSAEDPAGVAASADATEAMRAIQSSGQDEKASWLSRGDDSGTHKKELRLWAAAGVEPTPTPSADSWYEETGQGMGETLTIASERGAYTLADRATFLSMRDAFELEILIEKDKSLLNQYGVLVVTGAKNQDGGRAFADWIVSADGQRVVGEFGVGQYGQQLFVPNAQ